MFRLFVVLISVLLLGACASSEEKAKIAAEEDHAECVSLGTEFGTDAYVNCRMQLAQIRQAEKARKVMIWNGLQTGVAASKPFQCSRIGNTVYCQ